MNSFFLDTRALVKYYYPKIGSEFVETLILSEALLIDHNNFLDRYGPNISLKTLDALQCSYPIFLRNVTVVSLDLTLIKVVEVVEKENIKTINSEQA